MTDQTTPDVTDDDRRLAREWAEFVESDAGAWAAQIRAAARVILDAVPAPSPPTLADMTLDEQDECAGMQADLAQGDRVVILDGTPDAAGLVQVLEKSLDVYRAYPAEVTPRPDLARMEWPSEKKAEDVPPVKVGDVIESADDPRIADLPAGTVLRDLDGEEATRVDGHPDNWRGPGYIPVAGGRTAYGPWTVARLRRKPAPATTLPEGWRLADHEVYGRVVVTTTTPNDAGNVYFVFPDSNDAKGHYWHLCAPDRLTYLDADQEGDR